MLSALHNGRRGFTLVEIMIVVAIIALLSAIAVPNFLRARKRSQATKILQDLRMLDAAIDQWAIEHNKIAGANPTLSDLSAYLKGGSELATTGADLFGKAYGPFTVDTTPKLHPDTFDVLSDVAPAEFWAPYK